MSDLAAWKGPQWHAGQVNCDLAVAGLGEVNGCVTGAAGKPSQVHLPVTWPGTGP